MSILLFAVLGFVILCIFVLIISGRRLASAPKVFLLHRLSNSSLDASSFTVQKFENLLDAIDAKGLTIAPIEECLRDRTKVAITFDDAYEDLMLLKPLLVQRRLPLLVFVPTAFIGKTNTWDNFLNSGKRRHLGESQMRELAAMGVQFGSHGHTHRDLSTISTDDVQAELVSSLRILNSITGRETTTIAYPFGRSNHRVQRLALDLGIVHQFAASPLTK